MMENINSLHSCVALCFNKYKTWTRLIKLGYIEKKLNWQYNLKDLGLFHSSLRNDSSCFITCSVQFYFYSAFLNITLSLQASRYPHPNLFSVSMLVSLCALLFYIGCLSVIFTIMYVQNLVV